MEGGIVFGEIKKHNSSFNIYNPCILCHNPLSPPIQLNHNVKCCHYPPPPPDYQPALESHTCFFFAG